MTDCPNATMRDRLPDLLHEHLDANARAAVMAHVGECANCRAELSLLRQMRVSFSSTIVALDTAAIARTVVARTAASSRVNASRHRNRFTDWRLAAAIAILAVGGTTAAIVRSTRARQEVGSVATNASIPKTPVGASARMAQEAVLPTVPPSTSVVPRSAPSPRAELAASGDVSDLSDNDLRTLLGDLDTIEALPATDPEPVTLRVTLPESGGTE